MFRLFDVIYTENHTLQEKLIYLESCDNVNAFVGKNVRNIDNISKKIKELLSSQESRAEGLSLLLTFLPQCTTDVFTEDSFAWVQLCSAVFKTNEIPEVKKLASVVFRHLIQYSLSYSSLSKKISTSIISTLVEALLKISIEDEWKIEALELLVSCMTHYPGPCGNFKTEIEALVLKHLYSWHGKSLEVTSHCIALLPLIGGSGNLGASHSNAWSDQFSCILTSMNQLLEFFADQSKLDDIDALALSALDIPKLPSDPLMAIYYANRLYVFLGSCLQKMLSTNVSVSIKIPVNGVLSHVCNSLALRFSLDENLSLDKAALASLLPSQHVTSLGILDSLILCCRDLLVPNSSLIRDVLLQTLQWSAGDDDDDPTTDYYYSNLRKTVYRVLQTCVKTLGLNSEVDELFPDFYTQIYFDIKTKFDEVRLLKKSNASDIRSAKKKRRVAMEVSQISPDESHKTNFPDCDWETVKESLAALKSLLYACGSCVKDDVYKNISKTIVSLLLKVQQNPDQIAAPYSNPICRLELYKVLLAMALCPNSSLPPPYQPAIRLFSIGQRDKFCLVSDYCLEASTVCGALVHPVVAPLQFYSPLQIQGSYASEASETASNEADSEYQEDRDSVMEEDEEDEEYQGEYPRIATSAEEAMMKRPPLSQQPKFLGASHKLIAAGSHKHPSLNVNERVPQSAVNARNEIVLLDEEAESKNAANRIRVNNQMRTGMEERKPTPQLTQNQLQSLRKDEEERITKKHPQIPGVTPLTESPVKLQPRPKSVQMAINAKMGITEREVLDVSEEVVEMEEGGSEEEEEEYEDGDEEDDEGNYGREEASVGDESDEYYEQDEMHDQDDDEEDEDFMNNVYGPNVICYGADGKPMRLTEPKQQEMRKGHNPLIQKNSAADLNSVTITPLQRSTKMTTGIMRLDDCENLVELDDKLSKENATPITIQNVTSLKPLEMKKNGNLSLRNELTPKMNDSFNVPIANEQNHLVGADFDLVDISNSPLKDRLPIAQATVSDNNPKIVSISSTPRVTHTEVVSEEAKSSRALVENNISSPNETLKNSEEVAASPSNLPPEILNQKSPLVQDVEPLVSYEYRIEECVEEVEDDDDKQSVEDAIEPEAKNACIIMNIEEQPPVDTMLKDFVSDPKDD